MSQSLTGPSVAAVGPARLLVAALVPLVAFMAMAHVTIVGDSAGSMTPSQIGDRTVQWILVACFWVLPVILAAIAFMRIATLLGAGSVIRPLAFVGIVLLVAHVVAQAAVIWFVDTPTLGGSALYAFAILVSLLGWWAVDIVALLTCRELFRAKVVPRAALVIGLLTGLLLVLEVVIYVPALVGGSELHDTIGLPPMLLPLLWAVLGAILWRKTASTRA